MGIVNVTEDSFSDGGKFFELDSALAHAWRLIEEGADLLDIGGQSTRPGAPEVPLAQELDRVVALVRALRAASVPLSVDTSRPQVMRAALAAGASVINDVFALRSPGALEAVAASDCGVVLMHRRGDARTMQIDPRYTDVLGEVRAFLVGRADCARAAGVAPDRIAIDPGFGFGKLPAHNLELLARLEDLVATGYPVLAGWSRKSTLGVVTGRPVQERLPASLSAAVLAIERGARLVRVHDVAATVDAIKVWRAVHHYAGEGQ